MDVIASQTIIADEDDTTYDEFDFGDSLSFNVTLDLPQVSSDGKSDLIFELFGMDDDGGEWKGESESINQLLLVQRLMSRWKYQFSWDHWSQTSWAQPVLSWMILTEESGVLLQSNQDIKAVWLLRETENLALEADPIIPPNLNKSIS